MWTPELNSLNLTNQQSAWLLKPTILSQALKKLCQTFSLEVLSQSFMPALDDEVSLIEHDDTPLVREVFLKGDDKPLTYGRVIVPKHTYDEYHSDFTGLGSNPIGEKLLYGNPNVVRGHFQYARLEKTHPLSQIIYAHLPEKTPPEPLLARRSVFYNRFFPLLVTDVMLPGLPDYPE